MYSGHGEDDGSISFEGKPYYYYDMIGDIIKMADVRTRLLDRDIIWYFNIYLDCCYSGMAYTAAIEFSKKNGGTVENLRYQALPN